jgi:hypothetical protein
MQTEHISPLRVHLRTVRKEAIQTRHMSEVKGTGHPERDGSVGMQLCNGTLLCPVMSGWVAALVQLVQFLAVNLYRGPELRGCFQKFPDWPPGARTANGTALCH